MVGLLVVFCTLFAIAGIIWVTWMMDPANPRHDRRKRNKSTHWHEKINPPPTVPPKVQVKRALTQNHQDYEWCWHIYSFAKRPYQDAYYTVTRSTKDFKIACHLAGEAVKDQQEMYAKELLQWKPEYSTEVDTYNWEY